MICESMLLYKQDQKNHLIMEEKQLFFFSTPELWVENGRNKREYPGKRKYQAAQEGKKHM